MANLVMRVVVGCGNLYRRDDGVGITVIQRLRAALDPLPADVALHDAGTSGMDVIFKARDCRQLIIVDACRTGSDPGAVFRLPGSELELPHTPTLTLHDFRWEHALYAGKRLFGEQFPERVTVFLVEGTDFGFGDGLTPPVEGAIPAVLAQVKAALAEVEVAP